MNLNRVFLAMLLLLPAGLANAGVVTIGEFTGDAYEGFEAIIPPGPYAGPMPIFGGAATIDDVYADPWISFNLVSGTGDELLPYNGNLMALTPTGWTNFEFATPALKFGGFIGVVNPVTGGNVTFYDESSAVIDTLPLDLPLAEWAWCGWESDVPIARVEIHPNVNPGMTAVFDDMQVTFVPEPGALGLLSVGATLVLRRRR
jgi:hypothetical protein